MEKDNSKVLLELIKRQLLDMQWNLEAQQQWIKENNPRLVEWSSKDIKQNYRIIKGCLERISKRIS